jgi:hypothetical protein
MEISANISTLRQEPIVKRPLVTFKDEGETDSGVSMGPVTSFDADARPERGKHGMLVFPLVEYGTVDLENGEHDHGWLTKPEAIALAKGLGADFEEV